MLRSLGFADSFLLMPASARVGGASGNGSLMEPLLPPPLKCLGPRSPTLSRCRLISSPRRRSARMRIAEASPRRLTLHHRIPRNSGIPLSKWPGFRPNCPKYPNFSQTLSNSTRKRPRCRTAAEARCGQLHKIDDSQIVISPLQGFARGVTFSRGVAPG